MQDLARHTLALPALTFAADAAPNTGDTALVLVSAGLVMLMTPGLAFFYGGLVRSKNVLNTMMMSLAAVASGILPLRSGARSRRRLALRPAVF